MSYKDEFNKGKEKGKVQQITHAIKTWEEPGDALLGKVVEIGIFDKGKFETNCKYYLLDTDEGLVSTVLGAAADSGLEGRDVEGHIISIEFMGIKELKDGRHCNQFNIELL